MSRDRPEADLENKSLEELDAYEAESKAFGITTEQARLIWLQREQLKARK